MPFPRRRQLLLLLLLLLPACSEPLSPDELLTRLEQEHGSLPEGARDATAAAAAIGAENRRVSLRVDVVGREDLSAEAPVIESTFLYEAEGWETWTLQPTVAPAGEDLLCVVASFPWVAEIDGDCPPLETVLAAEAPADLERVLQSEERANSRTVAAPLLRPDIMTIALDQGAWAPLDAPDGVIAFTTTPGGGFCEVYEPDDCGAFGGPEVPVLQRWEFDAATGLVLHNELRAGDLLLSSWTVTDLQVGDA